MKWIIKFCFCAYVTLLTRKWKANAQLHPDIYLSLEDKIKRHGYPLEVHQVITDDGYILSAYRIPHGGQNVKRENRNKSAVLLMHGMGGSPDNWVVLGAKDSLPYYLADRGFDVWLGSVRGGKNYFNKHHVKYDWNKDQEYWDYSHHEIGKVDLAANIDYITSHANQSKVFFIGHSAAVPQFMILMSERPEYNDKIKIGAHYASAPIIKRMDYPMAMLLCSLVNVWKGVFKYLGTSEFVPQVQLLVPTVVAICQDPLFLKICVHLVGMFGSHDSVLMEHVSGTSKHGHLPVLCAEVILHFAHYVSLPNVAELAITLLPRLSTKVLFHFMDNVNHGDFRQYNYGPRKNMQLYGQKDPPEYKLNNCLAPVAFFYGSKDSICVKSDIYNSINALPNVILDYEIPHRKFTHLDFILAKNSTHLVYEQTYRLFRNYDNGNIPAKIGKLNIPDDL